MDGKGTSSPKLESEPSQPLKKRKTVEKRVVTVRVGENASKLKNEAGLASDSWSWRKYGQKPIKGSPYPRGYYKCSTWKGCSARKQVERCKTDASMFIVTYSSTHNHPPPDRTSNSNLNQPPKESQNQAVEELPETSKVEDKEEKEREKDDDKLTKGSNKSVNEENFYYLQSPIQGSEEVIVDQEDPFELNPEKTEGIIDLILEEELPGNSELKNPSTPKSEEHDFFDELEELPISSPFLNLMSRNFSQESIAVAPL